MSPWKLDGDIAEWSDDSVVLSFDQSKPANGLNVRCPAVVTESALRLFGMCPVRDNNLPIDSPQQLRCCGNSIRVTFAASDGFPVETQLSWHVNGTKDGLTSFDVVASVGTQMLDVCPEFGLGSRIDATEVLAPEGSSLDRNSSWIGIPPSECCGSSAAIPCVLFRLPGAELSYVEMIHPSDFGSYDIARDPETGCAVLRHRLFSRPLEKGVILRARLRGVLLRRDGDRSAAAASFAQFVAAEPPLGR